MDTAWPRLGQLPLEEVVIGNAERYVVQPTIHLPWLNISRYKNKRGTFTLDSINKFFSTGLLSTGSESPDCFGAKRQEGVVRRDNGHCRLLRLGGYQPIEWVTMRGRQLTAHVNGLFRQMEPV